MINASIVACAKQIRLSRERSWVIGYSGGKDSTAALKVFLAASKLAGCVQDRITIIYCDTGVENPELDRFAKDSLERIASELPKDFMNATVKILKAPVKERFFVRVIGRGYAPPSNRFRWCTKGLRVLPVQRFIASTDKDAAVVLGLRYGESAQRDRSLQLASGEERMWQKQREGASRDLFLPIIDFDLESVWAAAQGLDYPGSIDCIALEELYRGASEECPMVKSPLSPPCASGRFGCWTCTVVRRDKSTESMIRNGKLWLQPYLEFRNWLQQYRTAYSMRWPVRRNGVPGPGPFTLSARRVILRRLQILEAEVDREILSDEEFRMIKALWADDIERENGLALY